MDIQRWVRASTPLDALFPIHRSRTVSQETVRQLCADSGKTVTSLPSSLPAATLRKDPHSREDHLDMTRNSCPHQYRFNSSRTITFIPSSLAHPSTAATGT